MQNAKDSFYLALRDRIAAVNPARQVLVRGQLRPGVLAEENEMPSSYNHQDTFRLRWAEASADTQGPLPLVTLRCEIRYATAGTAGNGGMDRGRLLAAMDAELLAAVNTSPQRAAKQHYTAEGAAPLQTGIFWSELRFAPAQSDGEQIERTATVDIFSYQEPGEL